MSWSGSVSKKKAGEELEKALDELGTLIKASHPDSEDQIDAAVQAALNLVESGALGDGEEYTYYVTLSGHSNPEHKPASGMSNDFINIAVGQSS